MDERTQYVDIILFLVRYGSITNNQAGIIGVGRLSARIHEMRGFGIGIDTVRVERKTRHGRKTYIGKYVFHSEESQKYALERFGLVE